MSKKTEYPQCPSCQHEDREPFDLDLEGDGECTVTECGRCGAFYKVTMHLSTSYSTKEASLSELTSNE